MLSERSGGLPSVRNTAFGRVAAYLCVLGISLNMFAPLAWVASHPGAVYDADSFCQGRTAGDVHSGPAPTGPAGDFATHCPLCLVFGGTIWAPPSEPPAAALFAPPTNAAATSPIDRPQRAASAHFRPNPRAPPFLT
jgi:hypothetical protein